MSKSNVGSVEFITNWGIKGDVHAGPGHRQVSLLPRESITRVRARGRAVKPGAFGENITTAGVDLLELTPGDRISIGEALLEITQIGKECHDRCAIYSQAGDCIMTREGIFAVVLRGGRVECGDPVRTHRRSAG